MARSVYVGSGLFALNPSSDFTQVIDYYCYLDSQQGASVSGQSILYRETFFFLTQPQLVLLPRLTDLAHRRILGPQAESTPAWEELVWL